MHYVKNTIYTTEDFSYAPAQILLSTNSKYEEFAPWALSDPTCVCMYVVIL